MNGFSIIVKLLLNGYVTTNWVDAYFLEITCAVNVLSFVQTSNSQVVGRVPPVILKILKGDTKAGTRVCKLNYIDIFFSHNLHILYYNKNYYFATFLHIFCC